MFVDYSQLQQIAVLEQQTGLWLKTQVTPLFGPLVLFSQTFPPSGILHDGKLFVPLTQGQHTTGLGFSSLPFLPTVRAAQGDPRNINVWERDPSKPQNLENALYGVVNPPLLRTPISSEAEGGAMHPEDAKAGGNNLKLGWQILGHFGHIEPKLPTIKARDSVAEGYEAGLRRQSPQIGTIVKGIVDGDERVIKDLLPTPITTDAKGSGPNDFPQLRNVRTFFPTPTTLDSRQGNNRASFERNTPALGAVVHMLPTVCASEGIKATAAQGSEEKKKTGQVWLTNVIRDVAVENELPVPTSNKNNEIDLIGTPRTSSANGSSSKQVANGATKSRIEDQVLTTSWGKFEPAIRRWEQVIDRPAPAPTKADGKDGNHRLSSEFTEWLMGLPEGWVTDPELGLTRNEQLKLCGNGVVPQQAALALSRLLTGIDLNSEEQK